VSELSTQQVHRPKSRRIENPLPRTSFIVIGFLLAALIGLMAYFLPLFESSATPVVTSGGGILNPIPVTGPADPFTVLLLGSDDDSKFVADRYNTQSMILVRVDPGSKSVTMLSIPRDLWVQMPGGGLGKISTASQTGGLPAAVDVVQTDFHVHVDDYVWVGLKGLVKLIDSLGGVNLNVTNPVLDDFYPADINTSSPYGYYRVALMPGPVHLDGLHALQYVRSRHGDLRGDFARSERQQELLLAMKEQAKHLNVADLPDLANAMNGEIKTSISFDRMRQLYSVLDQYNGSNVHRVLLGPPYTSEGFAYGQAVVFPDWNAILPVVRQSFP
jgi:LCP family protein required for cell wall assembly